MDHKNIMTYGRLNRSVPKYIRFKLEDMGKNPICLNRMQAVSVADVLYDPAQTADKFRDTLRKRSPGYADASNKL